MKKVLLLVFAVIAMTGVVAQAAINLSRHDMGAMGATYAAVAGTYGDCSACHVPHKARGAKLWAAPPQSGFDPSFGTLGNLCSRCHDGASVILADVSANIRYGGNGPYGAPSTGMIGHRMNIDIGTPGRPNGADGDPDVRVSGFPHVLVATNPTYMECTSCHDVHAPGNRPFIASPAGVTDGWATFTFCERCHLGRTSTTYMRANASGLHPVDNAGTVTGEMTSTNGTDPNPIVAGMNAIAVTAGTGLATNGAWNSGQHSANGGLYCTSCHVIHGDEPVTYAEDLTTPSGVYAAALLFSEQITTAAPFRNQFCEGCHQGTTQAGAVGEWPNPGSTTLNRQFHPADSGANNTAALPITITNPPGFAFSGGGNTIVCTSCHTAHGSTGAGSNAGTANKGSSPMLRATTANPGASFCMYCHDAANSTFDCFHAGHVAGDGSGGLLTSMPATGMGSPFGSAPANGLDCNACHRAHNAPYEPILRAEYLSAGNVNPDQICTNCHTVNPSSYTTLNPFAGTQSLSSHFVGNLTLAAGGQFEAAGYGIAAGNVGVAGFVPERVPAWLVTATSVYGGTLAAGRGDMTCLSCHSMRYCGEGAGATRGMSGDGTNSTWMMIAASGNDINQPAGDAVADANSTTANYLCSGCHTNAPVTKIGGGETGFTHPLNLATAATENVKATFTMSKSADGRVNCESCHRAHDADSDSGTYILESNTAGASVYNGAPATPLYISPVHAHDDFCNGCHTK